MPIPTPTSASTSTSTPPARLEDAFQPILPKVDHILGLMREHQARLAVLAQKGEGEGEGEVSNGNGSGEQVGAVDLEDKIIKEASSARLLLNAQKKMAHDLPGGHLNSSQVDRGIRKTEDEIERNREILRRFDGRISGAGNINRIGTV